MSKGLEAFNKLENLLKELIKEITLDQTLVLGECIKAIEQELKRLEKIDNEPYIPLHINRYYELSKKEDVLEIIKNHIIEIREENIIEKPVNHELIIRFRKFDDMEEFELLKEVLL